MNDFGAWLGVCGVRVSLMTYEPRHHGMRQRERPPGMAPCGNTYGTAAGPDAVRAEAIRLGAEPITYLRGTGALMARKRAAKAETEPTKESE